MELILLDIRFLQAEMLLAVHDLQDEAQDEGQGEEGSKDRPEAVPEEPGQVLRSPAGHGLPDRSGFSVRKAGL